MTKSQKVLLEKVYFFIANKNEQKTNIHATVCLAYLKMFEQARET